MTIATTPTLAGFLAFVRGQMRVTAVQLPDDDPVISSAYQVAVAICNPLLACTFMPSPVYALAVYNLAASNLIEFAQDQTGQCFFEDARKAFHMNDFVAGVVNSSSDEGTSQSLTVPEAFETLTLADLQYIKNPYGRRYLAFAQRFGTLWALA